MARALLHGLLTSRTSDLPQAQDRQFFDPSLRAPIPTTTRCSARLDFVGTSGDLLRNRQILTYLVPAGHSVLLATVQNVGGGSVLIVHQTEEIFFPAP